MNFKIFVFAFLCMYLISCKTAQPKAVHTKSMSKVVIQPSKKPTIMEADINQNSKSQKTETLEATSKVKITQEVVLNYINQFKEVAIESMTKSGIPASITLAQGILESGAGTGALSVQANNHFGIKCHKEWKGLSVQHDDDALQECFRKYNNANQSYKDHAFFLTSRPRYAGLFKLQKSDYKAWAKGLRVAGYATDVKYPEKLIGIIEKYQLQKIDAQVLGISNEENTVSKEIIESQETIKNKQNSYIVEKGDTLYSISKKLNTSVESLKQKNNLSENTLSIGQILQIN